jgi:small subunit ribosomal protein S11
MAREATRIRRRERKNITSGIVHVNSSFNNTMVTITDAQGNTISWSSSGVMNFKGSRKSTPYAAQMAADSQAMSGGEKSATKLTIMPIRPANRNGRRRPQRCRLRSDHRPTIGSQTTAHSLGTNTMIPAMAGGIRRVSVQKYSSSTEGMVEYNPVPNDPDA